MELFVLKDGYYYKGGNEPTRYYLTNDALMCREIADKLYKEEVESFIEIFERDCRNLLSCFQKINDVETSYY